LWGGFFIFSSISEIINDTKRKDSTASFTFILSRRGREEKENLRKLFRGFLPIDGGGLRWN